MNGNEKNIAKVILLGNFAYSNLKKFYLNSNFNLIFKFNNLNFFKSLPFFII